MQWTDRLAQEREGVMPSNPEFIIKPMFSHHFRFDNFHKAFKTAVNPRLSATVVVHVE